MEVSGTVIYTETQKGTSKAGREWKKKIFVIEFMEGVYQKHLAFELFGDKRIDDNPIKKGQTVTVSFDIGSTEWNGRWFTQCNAYRVVKFDPKATPQNNTPLQQYTYDRPEELKFDPQPENEELPF